MNESSPLVFFVNGKKIEDEKVNPELTLLQYLRLKLRLTGTKLGCAEGGCGACTVMVSKYDRKLGKIKHTSVNACLAPVCSVHGSAVTTVEGIGSIKSGLHPVQERLAKSHGSQCGFCTPGFVMSMYTLLRNNPKPAFDEIEEYLIGNLCRCTGYRPILEGFRTFTEEGQSAGCGLKNCCKLKQNGNPDDEKNAQNGTYVNGGNSGNGNQHNGSKDESTVEETNGKEYDLDKTTILYDPRDFKPYDPSQDIIFPPELKLSPELCSRSLKFTGPRITFYRPSTLADLLDLKNRYTEAKVIIGNTEVGIETKYKNQYYPVMIHPLDISELMETSMDESGVVIGSAVPFSDVEMYFKKVLKKIPEHSGRILRSILEMLRWFAGRQIRNVAGFGGNIMTGSPISDINPILMACGAILNLRSSDGEREIKMDDKFYISYRKNIVKENEILVSLKIPFTRKNEYFKAYKQARRKDDDIAIVNSAMMVSIVDDQMVEKLSLIFGGMGPCTLMAKKTMTSLLSKSWDKILLETAINSLINELQLDPSAPGGMVDYRLTLVCSFFFKFYLEVRQELHKSNPKTVDRLSEDEKDAITEDFSSSKHSTQFFQNIPEGQARIDPVGKSIVHLSGLKQTTGEAVYIDDIPTYENELYAGLVLSTQAKAKILSVDPSNIFSIDGVHDFVSVKDVPGINRGGFVTVKDEEYFASSEVHFVGQIIGLVVAKTQEIAQRAAKLVQIKYEPLSDPIFTIKEAIEANSTWEPLVFENGNLSKGFKEAEFILEGESYMGGQDHFYLETNAHIAIPKEDNEMELICSTQNISGNQTAAAEALGISSNKVTCKVKRIGGGFGGKETRTESISTVIAVAAAKLRRPVRIMLDRHEDMIHTGGRHPFLGKWKVGFNSDGKVTALDVSLYSNAGYSLDLSGAVNLRAVASVDNVYSIPNIKVTGVNCRTNLASNTAFRGFGTPQACFVMEDIMTKVSDYLQVESNKVRELNFYTEDNPVAFYGQRISDVSNIRKCWEEVLSSGDYAKRKQNVQGFNKKNRFKKRGISALPMKYGIAFGFKTLNQSGVLLLVYKDGSVLISHGGMEMGQGIHTKMIQVASKALGIPMELIHIAETSTDKVPNTSPTAASSTADLNGYAIVNACNELQNRLEPYKKPNTSWKNWIISAYLDRVSLSVSGFYKTPDLVPYDAETKTSNIFNYFTYGAALSEVEIDCLTGHHTVIRSDIVMDVGDSLNPAIDIGQIEGAFMQGYGLFTIEQLVYSPQGGLISKGPGAYKIPSVQDVPKSLNVTMLRAGKPNPRPIYSSKALGEPPLFSAATVFFALREAVQSANRSSSGVSSADETFQFVSPATVERIRMACKDYITEKIIPAEPDTFQPWSLNI